MFIRSFSLFFGPNGEKLHEITIVEAETLRPATLDEVKAETGFDDVQLVERIGFMQIPVRRIGPDGKPYDSVQEFNFSIEASSRKEAFEKYESAAQTAFEELKAKQEAELQKMQNKLVIPNAAQAEAINKLKLVTE